jgi:hypothetical protein
MYFSDKQNVLKSMEHGITLSNEKIYTEPEFLNV